MKYIIFCLLFNGNLYAQAFSSNEKELNFLSSVKSKIEKIINSGNPSFVYSPKKALKRRWVNKNLSANELRDYMVSYKLALEMQRMIYTQREAVKLNFAFPMNAHLQGPLRLPLPSRNKKRRPASNSTPF